MSYSLFRFFKQLLYLCHLQHGISCCAAVKWCITHKVIVYKCSGSLRSGDIQISGLSLQETSVFYKGWRVKLKVLLTFCFDSLISELRELNKITMGIQYTQWVDGFQFHRLKHSYTINNKSFEGEKFHSLLGSSEKFHGFVHHHLHIFTVFQLDKTAMCVSTKVSCSSHESCLELSLEDL